MRFERDTGVSRSNCHGFRAVRRITDMRTIDFDYIADQIANMTRIPVRVIRNDVEGEPCAALYSDFGFTVDPAMPYLPDLCRIPEPCAYYLAPSGNQCFGVISSPQTKLILGPTWQMRPTRQELREYLFLLGIPRAEQPSYLEKLAAITPMPLNLFLHELSMIYYFITEKKLDLSDIFLFGGHGEHTITPVSAAAEQPEQKDSGVWQEPDAGSANTAYEFEKKMLRLITDGSPDGLIALSYVNLYITKVMTRNPLCKEMCCQISGYAVMTSAFFT